MDALISWPLRVSNDKAWTEEEGKFSEKPLLDEVRESIREGVRRALEDNARLDKQQGVFCQGFFWVKFGGGVELGGGCVHEGGFVVGSFAGFGQRVCIDVWPGC